MKRPASRILLVLAALAACCGGGCNHDTSGSGGNPPSAYGQCAGHTPEEYTFGDMTSCFYQGGDWDLTYGECHVPVGTKDCADFIAYDDASLSLARQSCFDHQDCTWLDPDGTVEHSPWEGGICNGTKIPCGTFDEQ